MKSLFSIAFLLAIFTPVNALPKYTITAVFNPTTKTITGKMQITFTNTSSIALKEIKILNFPHSYKEESTSLTEVNFEQLYPEKFNPGFMDITVKDQKESLQYEKPYEASINLVQPLKPHEEISIALFFNVQIPEKFGIFGSYKDTFNLTAQWYPNLCSLENSGWNCKTPPDKSSFTIDLSLPEHYTTILGDSMYSSSTLHFEQTRNYVPLIIANKLYVHTYEKLGFTITYYSFEATDSKAQIIFERLDPILIFAYKNNFPRKHIRIIDSYLREILTFSTSDFLLVSDRIFEVFWFFKDFHEFYFAQGIFEYLIYDKAREIEDTKYLRMVDESLAWYYFRKYQKESRKAIQAQDLLFVKIFWFIPVIQEALYAPQFAFNYAYLDQWRYQTPFPTMYNFNNNYREGKIITEKLADYLSSEAYKDFFETYLTTNIPYFLLLNSRANKDMKPLIESWRKKYRTNYFIKDIQKQKKDTIWKTQITLGKEFSDNEIIEPVTVMYKERWGNQYFLDWNDGGKEKSFTVTSKNKITLVEIDPHHRLLETTQSDNRIPPELQILVNYIEFSYDVIEKDIDAALYLQIRRKYNSSNRIDFFPFYNPTGYGGSIGFGRQFGEVIDALRISHFARISWFVENLNSSFIELENTNNETVTFERDSGFISSIIFGYSLSDILSYKNPQSGTYFGVSLELSHTYTGSEFNYYKTQLSYVRLFRLANEHTLGLRNEFGVTGNDDVPEQKQFSLGGIFNLRGIPAGKAEFTGKNKFLTTLEYRHPLLLNLNFNAGNWFRLTKIKGALFSDAGRVTETVADEQDRLLDPSLTSEDNLLRTFDIRHFSIDGGYSFQIFFDLMGIRETLLRIDIAKQIDHFDQESVKVYLSVDQPF